ncbi:hypothetical protein [Blastopirellula marina]|uniref:HEAT repeat domain-containing protein n=1 Tax=Blastopirellula marina TaxID=124 RepID=A0A2S8GTR8_9BACT|nr:hypothetical protein [Blastopirellula marina]PQO47806.1 hypothetical protein C5Y93_01830 [Blastopirellula marina]
MILPTPSKIFLATLISLLSISANVRAQSVVDAAGEKVNEQGEAVDARQHVRRLVLQLDANQFAVRQRASDELGRLGKVAIPAIEQAAMTGRGEVVNRSVDLLQTFARSPEDETAQMAIAALKHLAASENDSAAYRAGETIEKLRRVVGPGRIESLQPDVPTLPPTEVQRSVRLSNIEGKRTIEVTENGQQVIAVIDADGKVRVTWHLPDGEQKTVSAATAEALKQQDPASFAKLQELMQLAENIPGTHRLRLMPPRGPGFGEGFDPLAGLPRTVIRIQQTGPIRPAEVAPGVSVQADPFVPLRERLERLLPPGKTQDPSFD